MNLANPETALAFVDRLDFAGDGVANPRVVAVEPIDLAAIQ